ncbi:MAG TPA: phosphoribosyltransferase family protein [Cytophagales bacterium]|nr:phosphoribosyltransferase family protein [Cytophagales bacterium]
MLKNRFDAATMLAEQLKIYKNSDSIIMAIPKGGMEIGYILSYKLNLPLDVMLIKKIGHPANKEMAIGAAGLFGSVINPSTNASAEYIQEETQRLQNDLKEQHKQYIGVSKSKSIENKTVILTDDGIATGYTVETAIDLLKKNNVYKIIVAVPVAQKLSLQRISKEVDEVVCLKVQADFQSVSRVFSRTGELEAISLFRKANKEHIET